MPRLLLLVSAVAAGAAGAACTTCAVEEELSLLQTQTKHSSGVVRRHRHKAKKAATDPEDFYPHPDFEEDDACECLNWEETYARGLACGSGSEMAMPAAGGAPDPAMVDMVRPIMETEFCTNFYRRRTDNSCTNLGIQPEGDSWMNGQWCYVSGSCPQAQLGYGAPLPGTSLQHHPDEAPFVAWKTCTSEDSLLRSLSPMEIVEMARLEDLDTGLVVKMAYPVYPHGMLMSNEEQIAAQNGKAYPLVFDSESGHPPFHAVSNGTIVRIELTGIFDRGMNNISTATCIAGCPTAP